jgi:hypothetical protein
MNIMSKAEYERRKDEDFRFFVLCGSKGDMAMYQLLRDRDLDDVQVLNKQELRLIEEGA